MSSLRSASTGGAISSPSLDNFIFAQLPFIIPEHADKVEGMRGYFKGNPNDVLYQKPEADDGANPADPGNKADVDSLADSEDVIAESTDCLNQKTRSPYQTSSWNLTDSPLS